jgi:hypothetical protein
VAKQPAKKLMDFISSLFNAIASFFGFVKDKQTLENTPVIIANAQAEQIAKNKAQAVTEVNGDLNKLREDVSQ